MMTGIVFNVTPCARNPYVRLEMGGVVASVAVPRCRSLLRNRIVMALFGTAIYAMSTMVYGGTSYSINGYKYAYETVYTNGIAAGIKIRPTNNEYAVEPTPMGAFVIPSSLPYISGNQTNWLPVVSISEYTTSGYMYSSGHQIGEAFSSPSMTSVDIPDSVTYIGITAFADCTSLKSVKLPASLNIINKYAFANCPRLERIDISAKKIADNVFSGCTGLREVVFRDGLESIGYEAFSTCYCSNWYDFTLRNGTPCIALESVSLPQTVTNVEERAFWRCTGLKTVEINGAAKLGDFAFADCSSLRSAVMGDCEIGASAFLDCTNLVSIRFIGDAPTIVGNNAFSGVNDACTVYAPEGSAGWDDDGDGMWQGRPLSYYDGSKITITFDSNGGNGVMLSKQIYVGVYFEQAFPVSSFTREGYMFCGWSLAPDGDVDYLEGDGIAFDHDITVYAVWKKTISVSFDSSGGDGVMSSVILGENTIGRLPPNRFSKWGYVFNGWSTTRNGEVVYDNQAEVRFGHDVTLYAQWDEAPLRSGGKEIWTEQPDGSWMSGDINDSESTWIEKRALGKGILSFEWKISSEAGSDTLSFREYGSTNQFIDSISGDVDWKSVTIVIDSDGRHLFRWIYEKNEENSENGDCGWIRNIVWIPNSGTAAELAVWLAERNLAADDVAANGRTAAECYALGLDPTDETNDFRIVSIEMVDGKPKVEWEPKTNRWTGAEILVALKGAERLDGEWQAVTEENKSGFRFFKVVVEVP